MFAEALVDRGGQRGAVGRPVFGCLGRHAKSAPRGLTLGQVPWFPPQVGLQAWRPGPQGPALVRGFRVSPVVVAEAALG